MAKRRVRNANNVNEKGVEVKANALPGRPDPDLVKELDKKGEATEQRVLFLTPKGVMCAKVYKVFRSGRAKYRRYLRTEKNVKK